MLTECLLQHKQLPVAIHSGRAGGQDKLSGLLRASAHAMPQVLEHVMCMTTDMGTEFALSNMIGRPWMDQLPVWQRMQPLHRDPDDDPPCDDAACESTGAIFPNAFQVPGLLHICSNMVEEVNKAMQKWKDWLPGLQQVTWLLGTGYHRELCSHLHLERQHPGSSSGPSESCAGRDRPRAATSGPPRPPPQAPALRRQPRSSVQKLALRPGSAGTATPPFTGGGSALLRFGWVGVANPKGPIGH